MEGYMIISADLDLFRVRLLLVAQCSMDINSSSIVDSLVDDTIRYVSSAYLSSVLKLCTGLRSMSLITYIMGPTMVIMNGLRGKQLHIITSSPILAERDAKQEAKLLIMFCLTCTDNSDKTIYLKGVRDLESCTVKITAVIHGKPVFFHEDCDKMNGITAVMGTRITVIP